MYTMLSTSTDQLLLNLFMFVTIASFSYSLFAIWRKYKNEERIKLYKNLSIFAVILHVVTIPVNYFLGGFIGFFIGLLLIYRFFNKFENTYS